MNAGLLDFFILEASECVEQLDGLVAQAGSGTPNLELFARQIRALRGSATMAKVQGVADVAIGLERVAKALREGSLQWNEPLRAAVTSAIDDLKILIRGARTWGSSEERLAAERADELKSLAPAFRRRSTTSSMLGGSAEYLAAETGDVAAGLQEIADAGGRMATFAETLRRLRALRGVAALNDLPPLAEVVAAADEVAKPLELSGAEPTERQRILFRAAAAVLREGSESVHAGERPDPDSAAVQAFTSAAATFVEAAGDADRVVPISALFPAGEGHIIHAAENPATTTPERRFRLEVVTQAEHLRRLVHDARSAADSATRQRVGHELRTAVRGLGRTAESFGEAVVASSFVAHEEGAAILERRSLAWIEDASYILTGPGDRSVAAQFEALATPAARRSTPVIAAIAAAALEATAAAAETAAPTVAPAPIRSPLSGPALHAMLGEGIAGLSQLDETPLGEPVEVEDDGVVPIQDLIYRGRAALDRAIALGQTLREAAAPDAEVLAELYDLLELAATE